MASGISPGSLILVDAHALVYQFFHAIPAMSAADGRPTNAIFGFTRDLMYMRDELKPAYLLCAFDRAEPTFRSELYPDYKAHRTPPPDDLCAQIEPIHQVIEAIPWGSKPRHLLRDRDAVYGRDFRQRARRIGIDAIATPVRSPRANAVIERVIGTLRRECLDHLIILDERHLLSVLREFVTYYNQDRPHRTLGLQTPEQRPRPTTGRIRSRPVLNGLHHVYERAA